MKKRFVFVLLILSALCTGTFLVGRIILRRRNPRPNIIFILIDALRADHLGAYGHPGGHSPTLDALADESVVFDLAIAQAPWTQPSMASLFCSYYPSVHKVTDYGGTFDSIHKEGPKVAILNESFVTMPEVLQAAGYSTGAFVANPFILAEFGFAQGFDHFDASFAKNTTPGSVVNDAAIAWLCKREADKPFFCFLHYMDVHGPYNAGPEFLDPILDKVEELPNKRKLSEAEINKLDYLKQLPNVYTNRNRHEELGDYQEYWAARYDAGIREVDFHISQLRAKLKEIGLWQDVYLIVTADHGEALAEQHRSGDRIGAILLAAGLVGEADLFRCLGDQLGVPFKDDPLAPDPDALRRVRPEVARRHRLLPLEVAGRTLKVAMAEPLDLGAMDDLRFETGLRVEPVAAPPRAVDLAIEGAFGGALADLLGALPAELTALTGEDDDLLNRAAPGPFKARLLNADPRLDLLLYDGNLTNCLAWGDEEIFLPALAAGPYLLVVDGPAGSEGSYSLVFESRR